MRQVDYLKSIFQLFLGFLSEAGADELIGRCRREEGGETAAEWMVRLLRAPAGELLELVRADGDEEDKVRYLNALLWRQARRRVAPDLRVRYTFEEGFYNWLVHRQMVANGYDLGSLSGSVDRHGGGGRSYTEQVEACLGDFERLGELEEASHLAMLLNVIGPEIESYAGAARAARFARHLVESRGDESLRWLNPSAFAMLAHDLSLPPDDSWPLYRDLIRLEHNLTVFNYHGWLLGIRMYGQGARDELRGLGVPGGYDLLETLATS